MWQRVRAEWGACGGVVCVCMGGGRVGRGGREERGKTEDVQA